MSGSLLDPIGARGWEGSGVGGSISASPPKPTILIADDEPANRRLLADLVRREGYNPLTASGGAEALALMESSSIDLLLLDIMMPDVDGMMVLAELQKRQRLPALPVVVVTAHEDRKVRIDALKAGAIDFITKPVDRTEVACKIRMLIELKRLRDAATLQAAGARAQLRAVIDSAPDFVLSLDREGTIQYVNRVLPPQTPEQLVGSSWVSHGTTAEARHTRSAALEHVFETGTPAYVASTDVCADGSLLYFESHIGPVRLGEQIVGAAIVARDVTEKKRTEMQLMVSDRMASVGTLAAGVAHEINNPLAAVIANLDLARRDADALGRRLEAGEMGELQQGLRDASESAERIRLLVRDLKLFSRADEADRVEPTDIVRVLDSTLRMAWNELRHRARIVKDYGRTPLVAGNESRLGQVFLNLVVNAAQAIREGDAENQEIRIATSLDPLGRVQVEIRDTGPGIPPEVLRRLFTPFFTTKPVGVGTGLGLSICQRIVTSLGGEIRVESQLGRGTTFRVLLLQAASDDLARLSPLPTPARAAARRGKVLVIDDEPMIGQIVRRTLSVDHDVTMVERGQEALDLLLGGGSAFDVIFCDLMMPQLTGMDVYEQLSVSAEAAQAARIIFLTGGAFTARAREFLDKVPNLRVEKPFDVAMVRALVNDRVR